MPTIEAEAEAGIEQLIVDLRVARDLLISGGLCKGTYSEPEGPHCLVGALVEATETKPVDFILQTSKADLRRINRAVDAVATVLDTFDKDMTKVGNLYEFNDHDLTIPEDVIGLLNTTISRLGGHQ